MAVLQDVREVRPDDTMGSWLDRQIMTLEQHDIPYDERPSPRETFLVKLREQGHEVPRPSAKNWRLDHSRPSAAILLAIFRIFEITEGEIMEAVMELASRRSNGAINAAKTPAPQRVRRDKDRPWIPEEDALLGTLPDPDVGGRIDRDRRQVSARRNELGIPAFTPGRNARPWTADEDALLGTMPDTQLAVKLGVDHRRVYARRALLGKPAFAKEGRE